MSDLYYHPIYQQAQALQYKYHDLIANSQHPAAHALGAEIHKLVEDIEVKKNPLTLENRVKAIQRQLNTVEHQSQPFMSYDHANVLHHGYEAVRAKIRDLPNY